MFTEPVTLDTQAHRALRFSPNQPYSFCRDLMLIPLVADECSRAARDMPIVFPSGDGGPQALVGVRPGENLHVHQSGYWLGRYIPAHIRRYPFRLAQAKGSTAAPGSETRFVLQLDPKAEHFSQSDGYALLDEQGQPTATLKRIQQVLIALEQGRYRTQQLTAELDQAGLLVVRRIQVNPADNAANDSEDTSHALRGLRIVNEKALANLDAQTLAKLRDSGALAMAYAQLLSLSNLKDGVIAKAYTGTQTTPDIDELFDGDDDFTFDFDG